MTQIRRDLLVGCEGLGDRNVDDASRCRNVERTAGKRLDFPRTPESGGAGCAWARAMFGIACAANKTTHCDNYYGVSHTSSPHDS